MLPVRPWRLTPLGEPVPDQNMNAAGVSWLMHDIKSFQLAEIRAGESVAVARLMHPVVNSSAASTRVNRVMSSPYCFFV